MIFSNIMFNLILYVPVNNFSVMSPQVFQGRDSIKQGLMCHAQGHNAVTSVRLESATPRSRVKHSTTEPLSSPNALLAQKYIGLYIKIFSVKL